MMDTPGKYINPFTDFGFKRLFGEEFNKDLLIDFLNQVLLGKEHISTLTYLNKEKLGASLSERTAIFDLYCTNDKEEHFIIELQNIYQEFFKDRSLFYATHPIRSQAPKGKSWNYELKKVFTICILNFSFPDIASERRNLREVKLMDIATKEVFYDKLSLIYLEMPRFQKTEDQLDTHFDKWLYILKNLHLLQNRPVKLQERIFEKLFKEAEIAQLSKEDMRTYENSLKTYWDNYSVLETAKKEGRMEGIEQGKAQGFEDGIKKTAKKMLQKGITFEVIKEVTGLNDEELRQLQ